MSVPIPGTRIDRYQVQGSVGAGSMGDVVRAIDVDLKRQVAIKILSQKHRNDKELEARFVREGRAVASISHPNVVQVFTTGSFDDRPYIAMEFLTGTDLGSYIENHGPMPSLHASRACLDAARGLQAAAHAGLIHRDVKPTNLVMLDSGVVKVTDFGLAKPIDPKNEPALTAMGVVVGTPDYIAPEQARGEQIDERVDIYALGGTLFHLLVGRPPFRKGNPTDDKYLKVVARHLKEPPPDPRATSPEVDDDLAELQLWLMQKKANERPSYEDTIARLESISRRLGAGRARTGDPVPARIARAASRPARELSPTPYLGKKTNTPVGDLAKRPPKPVAHANHSGFTSLKKPQLRVDDELDASSMSFGQGPMVARSMKWATFATMAFLVVSLGLYLVGPLPSPDEYAAASHAHDAGPSISDGSPPVDESPVFQIPEGMIYVPGDETHGPFFIAKKPVSYGEYAAIFPNQKAAAKNKQRAQTPVDQVSFRYAQSYARIQSARLPTPGEYLSARTLTDFEGSSKFAEWVDENSTTSLGKRAVMRAEGDKELRNQSAQKNIGFRLARDLPSGQ